jgi:acyl-coenzyme A synthetase/AMP-(fatty) acid ligase
MTSLSQRIWSRPATVCHRPAGGGCRRACGLSLRRPCTIVYTSGSTGTQKGALLCEHGIVGSARLSWRYWYGGLDEIRSVVQHPVNHVGWLVCECVAGLVAGGSLYFRERFDGGATLRLIEAHKLNLWVAFPTMLRLAHAER